MSRDSWKNNRIIIVTVVFPNIWQLWVVSVIVMAGRERCGVFFLLNKGRGPRNVSQSFRNALLLRNRVFLDDSRSSLTSKFMSLYPANNCEKKPQIHKTDKLEIPISVIRSQISQKDPLIFTDRLWAQRISKTAVIKVQRLYGKCVFPTRTFSPRFRFSSQILRRCLEKKMPHFWNAQRSRPDTLW